MSVCTGHPAGALGLLLGLNQTWIVVIIWVKGILSTRIAFSLPLYTHKCVQECVPLSFFCPLKQKIIWPEPSTIRKDQASYHGRSPCQQVPGAQRQDCVCKAPLAGFPALVSAEPLDKASCPAHFLQHCTQDL